MVDVGATIPPLDTIEKSRLLFRIHESGYLTDEGYKIDNNIPYVLHQYDVIKQVEKELYEKYSR